MNKIDLVLDGLALRVGYIFSNVVCSGSGVGHEEVIQSTGD